MPDYNLGRAHGRIEIEYDDSGIERAARSMDDATQASERLDDSTTQLTTDVDENTKRIKASDATTQKWTASRREAARSTKEFTEAARKAADAVDDLDDVERRHTRTRQVHDRAMRVHLIQLGHSVDRWHDLSNAINSTDNETHGVAKGLRVAAAAMAFMGPEARGASLVLERLATKLGIVGSVANQSGDHIKRFVQRIAHFELAFGKMSGLALSLPSIGGLAGLGGAAGLTGILKMVNALRDLSGVLALLPAAFAGAGFSALTMKVAFHGVGDALKDMMADDPKKFLEDIKNMGPVAAKAMLQIASFRNVIKLGAGDVQDSFFKQIAADIQPLLQKWLPAVFKGMSTLATITGQAAHQFAQLIMQPQALQAFQMFIANMAKGMQSLAPAMQPLLNAFTQLIVVGSSFFQEIGGYISQLAQAFNNAVTSAAADGRLQAFIQTGINSFVHLINIVMNFASALNQILDMSEKFGGGGLLAWLEKLAIQFDQWTKSASGQQTLASFFATMQQATQAFLPLLGPLVKGIAEIVEAFVKLGIGIAPGWLAFFKSFADTMTGLGPQIVAMAPALNTFLVGLAQAMSNLMGTLGPQLPQIFQSLADSFVALLPQLGPLVQMFLELAERVGPMLPSLFQSVTDTLQELLPYWPIIIGFVRDFVSILTWFISSGASVIGWFTNFLGGVKNFVTNIPGALSKVGDAIGNFFSNLIGQASDWGKSLIDNFIHGITNNSITRGLGQIAQHVVDMFKTHSPAKTGPLHTNSPNAMGEGIVDNLAKGMSSRANRVGSAAASIAGSITGEISSIAGLGPGTTPGVNPAIGIDDSVLNTWLQHTFDPMHGLKGLAKALDPIVNDLAKKFANFFQNWTSIIIGAGKNIPALNAAHWKKVGPGEQKQKELPDKGDMTWGDLLGPGAASPTDTGNPNMPLGVSRSSSPAEIQRAIVQAGRARNMTDAQIQMALAVAGAESNYGQNIDGGVQGSAGHVWGVYQQSPSSGWGTKEQVLDPNYAINKFLDEYAKELAKNKDPLTAAVLTQNPQLGSSAATSDYANAVRRQMAEATKALANNQNVGAPGWTDVLNGQGGPGIPPAIPSIPSFGFAPSGGKPGPGNVPVPKRYAPNQLPTGIAVPQYAQGNVAPGGEVIAENPRSRASQIPSAPDVEHGINAVGGLPTLYPTSGDRAYEVPAWAQALAKQFGLTASTYASGGSLHQMGYAFDFNGPAEGREQLAQFITKNLAAQTLQLIYSGSQGKYGIASGQRVGPGTNQPGYYSANWAGHGDHVHWATDVPPIIMGPDGKAIPTMLVPNTKIPDFSGGLGVHTPGPGNQGLFPTSPNDPLGQIADNTRQSLTANQQLLQSYLAGNPALAQQISSASQPGATDDQVHGALDGMSTAIATLKAQDADGNKQLINALQSSSSTLATEHGFQKQPSDLEHAKDISSAAFGVVSDFIGDIQSVLKSVAATQDIVDRVNYGVRNTTDVVKLVGDAQTYLETAASFTATAASIANIVQKAIPDPGGAPGSGGPKAAAGVVSDVFSTITSIIKGVNAGIDLAKEVWGVAGQYIGSYLSFLMAGPNGSPLTGNVRELLNTNTGELLTYEMSNPKDKNSLKVPDWMRNWYTHGGQPANPQTNVDLTIFAGPGQTTRQMMDDSMWLVNTGGLSGVVGPENF